jgi:hypothetical protein
LQGTHTNQRSLLITFEVMPTVEHVYYLKALEMFCPQGASTLRKEPMVQIEQEALWAPEPVWTL